MPAGEGHALNTGAEVPPLTAAQIAANPAGILALATGSAGGDYIEVINGTNTPVILMYTGGDGSTQSLRVAIGARPYFVPHRGNIMAKPTETNPTLGTLHVQSARWGV